MYWPPMLPQATPTPPPLMPAAIDVAMAIPLVGVLLLMALISILMATFVLGMDD